MVLSEAARDWSGISACFRMTAPWSTGTHTNSFEILRMLECLLSVFAIQPQHKINRGIAEAKNTNAAAGALVNGAGSRAKSAKQNGL